MNNKPEQLKQQAPEPANSDRSILYLLSILHKRIQRTLDTEIRTHIDSSLSISHGDILFYLLFNEQATLSELTRHLCVTKSTMTVLVKKLEAMGWVAKVTSANDKRQSRLSLTTSALDRLADARPLGMKIRERLLANLDQNERAQLAGLLTKLKHNTDNW